MKSYLYPIFILIAVLIIPASVVRFGTADYKKEAAEPESGKKIKVYITAEDKVEEMDIEDYLANVLPAEMPPSFAEEALKAQAVAARTYVINKIESADKSAHKGGDVCTSPSHCQAYMTEEEAKSKFGEEWDNIYRDKIKNAVTGTKGEIITYESRPITAVFHSAASGYTENSEDVWSGYLPYLRSVKSSGDELSPSYESQAVVKISDFKDILKGANAIVDFDNNPLIGELTRNDSGSVKTVVLGGVPFKGTEVRSAFGLKSANFTITADEENVTFSVKGNGHGVGMSQYGANYEAKNGASYKDIINKYYQGVAVEKIY